LLLVGRKKLPASKPSTTPDFSFCSKNGVQYDTYSSTAQQLNSSTAQQLNSSTAQQLNSNFCASNVAAFTRMRWTSAVANPTDRRSLHLRIPFVAILQLHSCTARCFDDIHDLPLSQTFISTQRSVDSFNRRTKNIMNLMVRVCIRLINALEKLDNKKNLTN
jgi:hypothetical protein